MWAVVAATVGDWGGKWEASRPDADETWTVLW